MEHIFYIESLDLANDFEFYILNRYSIQYLREVNDYFYEFKIIGSQTVINETINDLNNLKSRNNYYTVFTSKQIRDVALEVIRDNKKNKEHYTSMEIITSNWENPRRKYSVSKLFNLNKNKKIYHLTDKPNSKGFYTLYDYTSVLKRTQSNNKKRYCSKDKEVLVKKAKELFGEN
jgi:hypothetical protein